LKKKKHIKQKTEVFFKDSVAAKRKGKNSVTPSKDQTCKSQASEKDKKGEPNI
jgi:hypothetical protein